MVNIMFYLNVFFVFSIIGHIIENIFHSSIDSGILLLPWTPIYGVGVVIILLINNIINKFTLNKWIKPFVLFICSSVILGILELIAGFSLEFLLGRVFWDYSKEFGHIGKYASLKMMLIWGAASIATIYLIIPKTEKYIKKIPKLITCILVFLFIIDFSITIYYLKDKLF